VSLEPTVDVPLRMSSCRPVSCRQPPGCVALSTNIMLWSRVLLPPEFAPPAGTTVTITRSPPGAASCIIRGFARALVSRCTFGAAGASVKLVVLNACYGEAQAEALRAHVECIIGLTGAVHDEAARNFAIGLYGGIGERESVATAYRQGCAAMSLMDGGSQQGLRDVIAQDLAPSTTSNRSGRPQLKVREGVDAERIVLAMDPQ